MSVSHHMKVLIVDNEHNVVHLFDFPSSNNNLSAIYVEIYFRSWRGDVFVLQE